MEMSDINGATSLAEILERYPEARSVFDRHGLHGCGGEHGPVETLDFFARVHQVDASQLLQEIREVAVKPRSKPYHYEATVADFIYRRFFKAGIAVVLTVGALWGADNLLQIALRQNFLQLHLVPAIHAHAHAMIFGWCGLFVMGFAYQSFPRFKHTTLAWPNVANSTLYLMLGGIAARVAAELLLPQTAGLVLGVLASVAEITAITLFITIILKTARQSLDPHNPFEKFIFTALAWFFIQSIFSGVFFLAKVTASNQDELIHRIALLDGPLRDIQLLGFAAMVIVGVSQRFVPMVYRIARPKRDRQSLIFWLMNGSLILDVVSYVLILTTGNIFFALGLEASFVLMLVWAVLVVRQLGIFSKPGERDRSWKFVRASYVWLLIAMVMLPFFPVYGILTHQYFAHSFMGAYRHAFTVGFISLMIMGIAARVVPILAGLDSGSLNSLWGPFILLNIGNTGRVTLQILTDFIPRIAYPLVGLTGFLEFGALAWWGMELWRVMNISRTRRLAPVLIQPIAASRHAAPST
jgi:NnrS protein